MNKVCGCPLGDRNRWNSRYVNVCIGYSFWFLPTTFSLDLGNLVLNFNHLQENPMGIKKKDPKWRLPFLFSINWGNSQNSGTSDSDWYEQTLVESGDCLFHPQLSFLTVFSVRKNSERVKKNAGRFRFGSDVTQTVYPIVDPARLQMLYAYHL